MVNYVFRLPDIGEGIAEVELVKWHVKAGDTVQEGQILVDVLTDKATVEISAPVTGTVQGIGGNEGSRLAVGADLAVFELPHDVEPMAQQDHPETIVPQPDRGISPPSTVQGSKAVASPAVRARARAMSIDLATIRGTGPQGRIEHEDLDRELTLKHHPQSQTGFTASDVPGGEEIKITGLRRRIAERLTESYRRIPHFTYVEEVDVTTLEEFRKRLNQDNEQRPHLTVLPFVMRAAVKAIARHPVINSHFDDTSGILRRFASIHAGLATQTERGLLVPVIRNIQEKDLWQIASEIARLSEDARASRSKPQELSGSTLTFTSLGALGGVMSTPIINLPEIAIIGINRILDRPAVIDGEVVIRKLMNLSSSFDHRIIDGYEAASFIKDIREGLENPEAL